jgi:hypothetical protein
MRKPRKGASYIMLSDGDLMSLWTADALAMASLIRQAGTYAKMTLEGITPATMGFAPTTAPACAVPARRELRRRGNLGRYRPGASARPLSLGLAGNG